MHRDLKPENVLRMPDGRLVLSDFGLTTQLAEPVDVARTIGVGTVRYMAPEQRHGGATFASDLYALGLVLHEIFFGALPRRDDATPAPVPDAAGSMTHTEQQLHALCMACLAIEPRKRPRSASAVVARLLRIQRAALANRPLHGWYVVVALGVASAAIAATWYRAVHDEPHGDTPRITTVSPSDASLSTVSIEHTAVPLAAVPGDAGSQRWQALAPMAGEFELELRAPIPRHVSTCPSPAWRSKIPGLPQIATESGLVGTLWRANLPLCLELQSHGVLLVYWGHRADEITEGTWMSSGRFVDLIVHGRANPSSPDFHWTAEVNGRTMLARPVGGESGTAIVLDRTQFDARKPAGCSSVILGEVETSASRDRTGSPFDAKYIRSRVAQPTLDACYRTYREAAVPHQETRWRLRHDERGQIRELALVYAEHESVAIGWFPEAADPRGAADGTARSWCSTPGYCENTFEGCVARALAALDLGPTTLRPDAADKARFWHYGGASNSSTYARVCHD